MSEKVEREFLPFVRRPGRYIGGEINQIKKDLSQCDLTIALCFPDVYEVAMSYSGLAIIYDILSSLRDENDPIVIAGGGMANCSEPMAEFIDLFVLGEGEGAVVELVELVREKKKNGAAKKEILISASEKFDWVYVPAFHTNQERRNAIVEDFENAPVPLRPIVPFIETVHERVSVEIMRGCPGRCRFCQASFCRRPVRYRSVEKIVDIAKACYHATGFNTVSLLSLSAADYPKIEELTSRLHEYFQDKYVGLSLPSLRVDQQLKLLPELLTSVRKSGLTIAVEAASEKLRQVINKPLKDDDLFSAVEAAYQAGWQKLKLYFMVGLPGETQEDVKRIVELSFELAKLRKTIDGKTANINITISWLVPKPHTPFGWLGQKPKVYFEQAKQLVLDEKRKLNAKFLQFKFHDINRSVLESAIGRGDRRLCDVLEAAWRAGARFDLWDECFNFEIWRGAFEKFGLNIDELAQRQFNADEVLPWEHLGGPDKKYLALFGENASDSKSQKRASHISSSPVEQAEIGRYR
nr:hypothetical protein [uncultured archaeon]